MWQMYDVDKDGMFSIREFQKMFSALGYVGPSSEVAKLFAEVDEDESGDVLSKLLPLAQTHACNRAGQSHSPRAIGQAKWTTWSSLLSSRPSGPEERQTWGLEARGRRTPVPICSTSAYGSKTAPLRKRSASISRG